MKLTRLCCLRAELFYDRGNHYEFLSLVQELVTPGEMRSAQAFDFEFKNVEKQYESYHGINVKLRLVEVPLVPLLHPISSHLSPPSNVRCRTMLTFHLYFQILRESDCFEKNGRCCEREGYLGAFVQDATR